MLTPWVSRIIFANIAVFLAERFIPSFAATSHAFALNPYQLASKPWTLATYMFLHADGMHIFFNMFSLYIFGPRVEAHTSGRAFLGLYLVSGITGGILSCVFPSASVIGASGATLGVMYAYAHYWPRDPIYLWFVAMPARIAVIVMAVLNLWNGFGGRGGRIAHFAHLGGLLGAFLYVWLIDRRPRQNTFQAKQQEVPRASRSDLDRWAKIQRDRLHEVNREEVDRIMAKIERDGVGSVTAQERIFLDNFSDRAEAGL